MPFGYTIIKTSELEDLQGGYLALTTRCENLSDEIGELRSFKDRMMAPLRAANEARRAKREGVGG